MSEAALYYKEVGGKFALITGTRCNAGECLYHGCSFPDCATTGKEYKSKEALLEDNPQAQKA